jgi:DNA-binding MarR family transcriptional regulator
MIKTDGYDRHGNVEGSSGASPSGDGRPAAGESGGDYCGQLEQATRGLLELTVAILERMDKSVGLSSLRALQSLRHRGPSLVTELANDLDMLVSTASRLSDRLAEARLITRRVSPTNRRATQLDLAPRGQAVLDELVAVRTAALAEVTAHMDPEHRQALLSGARAFSATRAELTGQTGPGGERIPSEPRPGPESSDGDQARAARRARRIPADLALDGPGRQPDRLPSGTHGRPGADAPTPGAPGHPRHRRCPDPRTT